MDALINVVMVFMIAAVTLASYLSSIDVAPKSFRFLPEVASVLAILAVIALGTRQRFRWVGTKYWLVFSALAVLILCGLAANSVAPGPIVFGVRFYLRAIPFFLLPAVYDFKDWQLRLYLRLLGVACLIQLPLAMWQRHSIMSTGHTSNADAVSGTMMTSGALSFVLTCALCLLGAGMLRGRIPKWVFALAFVLFMIPMSINETKVTPIILPLGVLVTFTLAAPPHRRARFALLAASFIAVGASIFIPVFDYYQAKSAVPYKISDFFTQKDQVVDYLDSGTRVGEDKIPGRLDALTVPLATLAHDPIAFTFGYGMGNTTRSSMGSAFSGAYNHEFDLFTSTSSAAQFLLEIGVLGLILVLLLHWLIFRDTIYVALHDTGSIGSLALGFVSVIIIMTLGLIYIAIHTSDPLAYLFWFFAGLICARRQQLLAAPSSTTR